METHKAVAILHAQLVTIGTLEGKSDGSPEFWNWKRETEVAIEKIFGIPTRHLSDFQGISFHLGVYRAGISTDAENKATYRSGLEKARLLLQSLIQEIREYGASGLKPNEAPLQNSPFDRIAALCRRFPLVVRQMKTRHNNRRAFEILDEYDVQDLLHALLRLTFDDIRTEESTPSYAGGCARMDFLIKPEKIVIETKKTRKTLGAKELGDQLILDCAKYQNHRDCRALICFVYDPEGFIENPRGLEADLSHSDTKFQVKVIIAPEHPPA